MVVTHSSLSSKRAGGDTCDYPRKRQDEKNVLIFSPQALPPTFTMPTDVRDLCISGHRAARERCNKKTTVFHTRIPRQRPPPPSALLGKLGRGTGRTTASSSDILAYSGEVVPASLQLRSQAKSSSSFRWVHAKFGRANRACLPACFPWLKLPPFVAILLPNRLI